MRKPTLIAAAAAAAAALALPVLAAGAAGAQQARGGAMEGPRHPCRSVAMAFDDALKEKIGPAVGNGGQFPEATQTRNQGMEACNAGRVEEGRRMIREATAAVRG